MCNRCDYSELLTASQLEATANRLRVLEIIGGNTCPLSAADIFKTFRRDRAINRVTVYRILELLVAHGVVDRLSTGGRAFYYGLAPNRHHPPHSHFYCTSCGRMDCLDARSLAIDADRLQKIFAGHIERVEVRVDGVCKNCLRTRSQELLPC